MRHLCWLLLLAPGPAFAAPELKLLPDALALSGPRDSQGRRIDAAHPASSLFLLKPTMTLRHGGGEKLTPGSDDYAALAGWIAQGAVAPGPDDVRIDRLDMLTPRARLAVGDKLRVLVRA